MKIWKKFEGLKLVSEKGAKALLLVRGPGMPEVEVVLTPHGQPVRKDNGKLLEPAPSEYLDDASPEPAARPRRSAGD